MKGMLVATAIAALLVAGCEAENDDPAMPRSLGEIEIVANAPGDRDVGEDLRRYMIVNCPPPGSEVPEMKEQWGPRMRKFMERGFRGWRGVCDNVRSIEVEDRRITMTTGLDASDDLEAAGLSFCNLVQGSDVADFTAGHELLDSSGETIENCGTRNAYR